MWWVGHSLKFRSRYNLWFGRHDTPPSSPSELPRTSFWLWGILNLIVFRRPLISGSSVRTGASEFLMQSLRALPVFIVCALLLGAGALGFSAPGSSAPRSGRGELHYRVRMQFRGEASPVDTDFVMQPTAVLVSHNRIQKPRLGSWRIEGVRRKDGTLVQPAVLARVERLLFFSGPTASTIQKPDFITYGGKRCRVWQVDMPKGLNVYAYLVEVLPRVLALSYFSGTFDSGDLVSAEVQLERFRLPSGAAPAEDGTALLSTLKILASRPTEMPGGPREDSLAEVVE